MSYDNNLILIEDATYRFTTISNELRYLSLVGCDFESSAYFLLDCLVLAEPNLCIARGLTFGVRGRLQI